MRPPGGQLREVDISGLGHVRSLKRGLEILQVINQKNGLKAAEVAAITGIPRPTVYRLLETLEEMRFLVRDRSKDLWRVALHVKSLSSGFRDADWVIQTAVPEMVRLGRQVLWPIDLVTFKNHQMEVRESTHNISPYSLDHGMVGLGMPVLETAGGRAFLAFSSEHEREHILDGLEEKFGLRRPFVLPDGPLDEILVRCRKLGVGYRREGFRSETESLSAPIFHQNRVIASLTLIWMGNAMKLEKALGLHRDTLVNSAAKITSEVESLWDEVHSKPPEI